jgi:hypothetical protein
LIQYQTYPISQRKIKSPQSKKPKSNIRQLLSFYPLKTKIYPLPIEEHLNLEKPKPIPYLKPNPDP